MPLYLLLSWCFYNLANWIKLLGGKITVVKATNIKI